MIRNNLLVVLLASLVLVACGGRDANIPGPQLPLIVIQPADQSVVEGATASFSVSATGAGTLTYQWQFSSDGGVTFSNVSGATSSTYTTMATTLAMNNILYRVIVSNGLGNVTSSAARLAVTSAVVPPAITVPPANQTVTAPAAATFTVTATGTNLAFQWQVSTDGGATFTNISGATAATLTVSPTSTSQSNNRYRVVVSNSAGTVTSAAAVLTVNPTPVAPTITQQPASATITAGGNVNFIVAAAGTPTPTIQWRLGGTDLANGALTSGPCSGATVAGATGTTLTLTGVPLGCNGAQFTAIASNGVNPPAISNTATLTVNPAPVAPSITTQPPATVVVTAGQTATFSAAASGVPSPTLQWQISTDGGATFSNITGATSASYTTPATVVGNEGQRFRLVATNSQGSATSTASTLFVYQAPTVGNPADASVIVGQSATFSVTLSGGQGPATLQWQRAEAASPTTFVDIAGATGTSYTTAATVTGDNNARFRVRWSNRSNDPGNTISNSGTSNAATLSVVNAFTATQVVAGYEWTIARRPDGTVWGWGSLHRTDGTVTLNAIPANEQALRPVRMYPAILTNVRQVAGWYDGWYALLDDGRVLHWGNARDASDGRGVDGAGTVPGSMPQFRFNATPVEVLEIIGGTPQPVNRVCSIAASGSQLLMIRSIDDLGATTNCNAGSAKTVWYVGSYTGIGAQSTGIATKVQGLPQSNATGYSPPSIVAGGQSTSGTPPVVIGLEDGRAYGLGENPYNGFGVPVPPPYPTRVGSAAGPRLLGNWGNLRGFGFSFYYSLFGIRSSDGAVFAAGLNQGNELGNGVAPLGSRTDIPTAVVAETCAALPCADILTGVDQIVSTNSLSTLALRGGQIWGWGANQHSLLGVVPGNPIDVGIPRLVSSAVAYTQISASHVHAAAIGPGNAVYTWGRGWRGALGDGVDGNVVTAPTIVTQP